MPSLDSMSAEEFHKGILASFKPDSLPFPIGVFPPPLRHIIAEYTRLTGAPDDFLGGAMLTVCGAALGNNARISYGSFFSNGVLFVCVVGRRGTGKSHPLNFALAPLKLIDASEWEKYKLERTEWETDIARNPNSKTLEPKTPPTIVVSDTTPESLVALHERNPRSLLIHRDELSGFVESFDRYSNGAESQKWLEIWSGTPVVLVRKTTASGRIESPHISILGGIQPEILPRLAGKNRVYDGFLDRFLFCYPSHTKAAPLVHESVDSIAWHNCIGNIHTLQPHYSQTGDPLPRALTLSPEAEQILAANDAKLITIVNESDDTMSGIAAKLRIYQYRLALILQAMQYGCYGGDFTRISKGAAEGAVILSEYFMLSAEKVHGQISKEAMKKLNIRQVKRLREMGKTFHEIHEITGLPVATAARLSKM